MLRFRRILIELLEPTDKTIRPIRLSALAKTLKMPVPSLHNYVNYDVLPRVENMQKISDYCGESVSSLFSDDDDTTAQLIAKVRTLSDDQKEQLQEWLEHVS